MSIKYSLAAALIAAAATGSATAAPQAKSGVASKNDVQLGAMAQPQPHLVDARGMTLYRFARDTGGVSTCEGACARKWPPLLTYGHDVRAAAGVDRAKIGVAKRVDGALQVTYAGWPLYYYYHDAKAGDLAGQGVRDSGDVWAAITPDGQPLAARTRASTPKAAGH